MAKEAHKLKESPKRLTYGRFSNGSRFSKLNLAIFALLFAGIGSYFLFSSYAATTCDLNATPSNFTAQVSAITSGQTICLASGNYGTWNTYNSSSKSFTVAPQPGATPIMCFEFGGAAGNITIDGGHINWDYTTPGINSCEGPSSIDPGASNIRIERMAFHCATNCSSTGMLDDRSTANGTGGGIFIGPGNIFHDEQFDGPTGIFIVGHGPPTDPSSTQIISNLFENFWPDAIDPGSGVTITGNDFFNIWSPSSYPGHTDVIQFNDHDVIKGNFIHGTGATHGCTEGITNYDTGDSNVIEDNVIVGCDVHSLVTAGDNPTGSLVDHNTVIGAGGEECGTKSGLGYPSPSLTQIRDNILQYGINWGGIQCTPSIDTRNMSWPSFGQIHSGTDFTGTPSFVGVAGPDGYPNTYAGYGLAVNSAGKNAASDGADVGARVSLYSSGRPDGSGSTPVPGDLDNNGHVNVFDLSILLSHWNQTGPSLPGDLDNNNIVNIFDLSVLLSHYGT